jgi:Ca2+-binding RTX toxin-like protein
VLTAGDDLITGALNTLSADDRISDGSTTDNDVMNVTLNRAVAMDVTNIENININWDGFASPTFDLDDVDGATVTITSARTGYLGNATFDNTGNNSIAAGAGVVGTLTVDAIEDASVTATVARTIDINNADGAITVNAGAAETVDVDGAEEVTVVALEAETVSVTGGENITVVALAADDVTLDDDFDVATVTLGVDADVDFSGADDAVVNLNSDEDITVTILVGSTFEVLNLGGEGTIDLEIDMGFDDSFTADFQINGGGDITLSGAIETADLTGIEHSEIRLATVNAGAATLTVGADANLVLEVATVVPNNITFQMNEDLDTAADSMTLTLEATQAADLIFTTADQEIENVKIVIDPNADFDTDNSFTIANLIGSNADDGPATAFEIVSEDDDVSVVLTDVVAATVDASGVAGEFTATQEGNEDMTVFAAAGASTVNFEGTTTDSTFISGNDADDEVTFDTTTGTAVAQFAGGNNTVTTGGILALGGTIAVIGADGDDTVTIATGALGTVSLLLGDGDNSVTLTAVGATGTVVMETGDGDDTLSFAGTGAASTIVADLGAGVNTLNLANNASIADANLTVTGLDVIDLDGNATVAPGLINGQDLAVTGSGSLTGSFTNTLTAVLSTTTTTFDGSGLDFSDGLTDGALGLVISGGDTDGVSYVGSNGSDSITGTGGDDTIVGGTGDDTLVGGEGDDVITGGAGADVLTGGDDDDTFVFASRAHTKNATYAGTNLTVEFDAITDFAAAEDVIQLSSTAAAFGTGITLSADTVFEVTALTDANDFESLTELFAGIEATAGADGVASTSALVQVYVVTLTDAADDAHFDGGDEKRLLIINDGTEALTVDDMIIDITGITGALTADNFIIA